MSEAEFLYGISRDKSFIAFFLWLPGLRKLKYEIQQPINLDGLLGAKHWSRHRWHSSLQNAQNKQLPIPQGLVEFIIWRRQEDFIYIDINIYKWRRWGLLGVVGHTIIRELGKASKRRDWYLGKTGGGEGNSQRKMLCRQRHQHRPSSEVCWASVTEEQKQGGGYGCRWRVTKGKVSQSGKEERAVLEGLTGYFKGFGFYSESGGKTLERFAKRFETLSDLYFNRIKAVK